MTMTPDRLRALRKSMGLTQEALASSLGVSRLTVIRWEADQQEPEAPQMLALALAAINAKLEPMA